MLQSYNIMQPSVMRDPCSPLCTVSHENAIFRIGTVSESIDAVKLCKANYCFARGILAAHVPLPHTVGKGSYAAYI